MHNSCELSEIKINQKIVRQPPLGAQKTHRPDQYSGKKLHLNDRVLISAGVNGELERRHYRLLVNAGNGLGKKEDRTIKQSS
jgi:hypothetical protein